MAHFIATFLLTLQAAATPAQGIEPAKMIHLPIPSELVPQAAFVQSLVFLDLDIAAIDRDTGSLEVVAYDDDLRRLEQAGMPYEVVHQDLQSFYASRLDGISGRSGSLGAWLNPPFGQGGMGGYYTLAELESVLDQINTAYPSITTPKASIGTSVEGRNLWSMKISDNPLLDEAEPECRFDALHHAREAESIHVVLWYMLFLVENYGSDSLANYLVDERENWFVPAVNPDGYVYNQAINPNGGGMWRKNRRNNGDGTFGIDLNRNYPYEWGYDDIGSSPNTSSFNYRGPFAASEPETAAMVAFISSHDFQTVLTCHCYGELWLYPWGYDFVLPANEADYIEVSNLATEINQYSVIPGHILYPANGVTDDYDHGTHGSMAWTPEIGNNSDGFWPPSNRIVPLAEENLLALQRTALAAGAFVNVLDVQVVDLGDGDGAVEPGETVGLTVTVRNSGMGTTGTSLVGTLSTADANLALLTTTHDFGTVAGFSDADNSASPLTGTVSASATAGDEISYNLSLEYEGFVQNFPGTFVVGQVHTFIFDDLEIDVGWVAGVTGDTADKGLWEYGNPVGTSNNGEPSNPEDDATGGSGILCYLTGNAGGSAGNDDVDNGFTTLLSPAFDLSGVDSAFVSYSRWFAMFTTLDDTFDVDISNDNGANWVSLESVSSPANEWTRKTFRVEDFIAQTDQMRLRFVASDDPNNSVIEAAVDDFQIEIYDSLAAINLYGEPALGTPVQANVSGQVGDQFIMYLSPFTADLQVGGFGGSLLLDPTNLFRLYSSTIPTGGLHTVTFDMPTDGAFVGVTAYFQAVVFSPTDKYFTNRDEITFTN